MKLLNNEGHFQFIKNQQVRIDETLPKYKVLEIKKRNKNRRIGDYDLTVSNSGPLSEPLTESVDKTLRESMLECDKNNIRAYLSQSDAKEFNDKFKPILEGEVDLNGYSLHVIANRWINEYASDNTLVLSNKTNTPTKPSFWQRLKDKVSVIKDYITPKKGMEKEKVESLNVINFFDTIHVMVGKEKEFINRLNGYFNLIHNAAMMHQDAQLDELCQGIIINIYESVLATNGYHKYITFGELEKLKHEGGRIVDIDYISNFGRIIPNDIVEKKIECDSFCVFDNYCVMYYDPSGETYKVTSSAKRDPILFGLINHSNKLYYIGDWVDETCDLTLEKVAELSEVKEIV